ncbi:hypothetical protein FHR81_002160 [Actinoalloteichus hoggarensis]|uniref:Uncharacterized protein n=1 Tax=Actinoalloteichus hoggarensis TaxID=1470176 RepID=A0A221W5H7_9PSEU|nr:DUF4132 domain-containing protein [Actinoalloteichus hoggarensis]ASO21192.1 hypothetical protein AHOG_17835 [Actinoalloteichus hoggarensis]MBB5921122.1 hypothetical protein [Actinoalloteichus hoggarensis]
MPETPPARPDEDAFVVPDSWHSVIAVRRGAVRHAAEVDPGGVAKAAELTERATGKLETALGDLRSPADLVAAARATLAGEPTPSGVATVAAVVSKPETYVLGTTAHAAFADAWTHEHGIVFAAEAACLLASIVVGGGGPRQESLYIRGIASSMAPEEAEPAVWRSVSSAMPVLLRVRTLLAGAADRDYDAAAESLSGLRGGLPGLDTTAYLLPTRTDWVDEACATSARSAWRLLIQSVSTEEQLTMLTRRYDPAMLLRDEADLKTVVAAVGTAAVPALVRALNDDERQSATGRRRLLEVLASLPADEAVDLVVAEGEPQRPDPLLLSLIRRAPARALRRLAAVATGGSPKASVAADVLRRHVTTAGALVDELLPSLPADSRDLVVSLRTTIPARPETAPDSALPELLVEPPWRRRRDGGKPVVLRLSPPDDAVSWADGERQAWADTPLPPGTRRWGPDTDWPRAIEDLLADRFDAAAETAFFLQAPVDLVAPLLRRRRHALRKWPGLLRPLAARFGAAALDHVVDGVERRTDVDPTPLLPFVGVRVATLVAGLLPPRTSLRPFALAWLERHGLAAVRALVPAAFGKAGTGRSQAREALRIAAAGRIEEAAATAEAQFGERAGGAVRTLLSTNALDDLPARLPALPDWLELALLPPILLRGRRHALPDSAVEHVVTMLALSAPGREYAGVEAVREACDPASLAEFGWQLLSEWRRHGMGPAEGWVLTALGMIGDDETVRRLTPLIRVWPGQSLHHRAVDGLDVLAGIGTDVALTHLHALSQKVRFAALRGRAARKIAEVAAERGLGVEELADRLVPDCGLAADGSLTLDYGPRRFTVGFDESLAPFVRDEDGRRRKTLPKPGARDDAEQASAAYARFTAMKKDVRMLAADQIRRLERAMVGERRWSTGDFRDHLLTHPLLWHLVRRLVWLIEEDGSIVGSFRVAEDRSLADVDDEPVVLPEGGAVGVAHPLHLTDSDAKSWAEVFADYEITQPFPQLARPVHRLSEEERGARELSRFQRGPAVPPGRILGMTSRGWEQAAPQDNGEVPWISRPVPGGLRVVAELDPGLSAGDRDAMGDQTLERIWLTAASPRRWFHGRDRSLPFGELDAITASELLTELTSLSGVAE